MVSGVVRRFSSGRWASTLRQVHHQEVTTASIVLVAACGYAAWDSGVAPFTATSYWAVGAPVALLALLAILTRRRRTGSVEDRHGAAGDFRRFIPTLTVVCAAIALEAAGLALGGRSPAVPTLSTVLDHLLRWRALRAALLVAWLCAGFLPVVIPITRRRSPEDG